MRLSRVQIGIIVGIVAVYYVVVLRLSHGVPPSRTELFGTLVITSVVVFGIGWAWSKLRRTKEKKP